MAGIDLNQLSETDAITKFILPAIFSKGWDSMSQLRQEVALRDGKVMVKGQVAARVSVKSADIVLYHKPNMPLAVIEAKACRYSATKGMQQGLDYARLLDVPFIFATNGKGFVFHDKTNPQQLETEITLEQFPTPEMLWAKFCLYKGYPQAYLPIITQDYYSDGSGKAPRYYQMQAINKTVAAVVSGQQRLLLVMATGTGKTYTAFQIIWRLWQSKFKKRILFLADRNILVDQTKNDDFLPFGTAMTKIENRTIDPAYEIHLGLYQAMTGTEESQKAYKQVSPDFFDLVIIDECHRGSASEESSWREILEYFSGATQIGLTATPTETKQVSNSDYFGEPIYTYSLKEGIEDGFLAPYKVIRVDLDIDQHGWTPEAGQVDKYGHALEQRDYNQKDYDRALVIDERTQLVAETISRYLKQTDPMAKTIVFCNDIDHADRMRRDLVNCNPEQVLKNDKYVMKITGDDLLGKAQLYNFINSKKAYPVIVTTSELMTTGVNAKTCKLVVLDQNIQSMTKFKQIIGRGTRIEEKFNKLWFTILDFKGATELFRDDKFDGPPEKVYVKKASDIAAGRTFAEDEADSPDGAEVTSNNQGEELEPGAVTDGGAGKYAVTDKPVRKFHVNGVEVSISAERVQYYGNDGELITESFKDYTRNKLEKRYTSLDDFVKRWQVAERKQVIIDELAQQGVIWEALVEEVGKDLDPFDMICHVVYDQPPLTRKERAEQVKKRDYFSKYSGTAKQVLEALLDKYADEGVHEIENISVLKITPFDKLGGLKEIITQHFGDKVTYHQAVTELEAAIYEPVSRSA